MASLQILTSASTAMRFPLACVPKHWIQGETAFPFCECKKGETRRRIIAHNLHKEVQDLLTKGDTRSPHKRNV